VAPPDREEDLCGGALFGGSSNRPRRILRSVAGIVPSVKSISTLPACRRRRRRRSPGYSLTTTKPAPVDRGLQKNDKKKHTNDIDHGTTKSVGGGRAFVAGRLEHRPIAPPGSNRDLPSGQVREICEHVHPTINRTNEWSERSSPCQCPRQQQQQLRSSSSSNNNHHHLRTMDASARACAHHS
jgi:hypothetical protein